MKKSFFSCVWLCLFFLGGCMASVWAEKRVAYIYGNVAEDGTLASDVVPPDTPDTPYDQMLLTDAGDTGMSMFKELVELQLYTISQHYDQETVLNQAFLSQFDVVVFGLHQKVWSPAERLALDVWIKNGGGILMYSDSASGGFHARVGIHNQVGQTAVNSILNQYGMEVSVDQGGGVRAYRPDAGSSNPMMWDQLIFEGEGVSPIAVDPNSSAEVLIPLDPANRVSGGNLSLDTRGITIANPEWAVIALNRVGNGHVMAVFDRQPFWNDGPGSDIERRDNEEFLRRIVRFLARDYGNSNEWLDFKIVPGSSLDFQVSYRQWSGGAGQQGFDYVARNNQFCIQQQTGLDAGAWRTEAPLMEEISTTPYGDDESETVILRLMPDSGAEQWFARLAVTPVVPVVVTSVEAGGDRLIASGGAAAITSNVVNATSQVWSKVSGPGDVTFEDSSAASTTATFSATGVYVLGISASSATATASDTLTVRVVESADITIAINSGGGSYNGQNGINYLADQSFVGGGTDAFPNNPVAGTEDDALYNFARSKGDFSGYNIEVANGNYLVLFHLAETFFTSDNQRVYDLTLEGVTVLDDIDLHEESGGRWVALERVFSASVSDGVLNIDVSASINNPLINGIVVIAQP